MGRVAQLWLKSRCCSPIFFYTVPMVWICLDVFLASSQYHAKVNIMIFRCFSIFPIFPIFYDILWYFAVKFLAKYHNISMTQSWWTIILKGCIPTSFPLVAKKPFKKSPWIQIDRHMSSWNSHRDFPLSLLESRVFFRSKILQESRSNFSGIQISTKLRCHPRCHPIPSHPRCTFGRAHERHGKDHLLSTPSCDGPTDLEAEAVTNKNPGDFNGIFVGASRPLKKLGWTNWTNPQKRWTWDEPPSSDHKDIFRTSEDVLPKYSSKMIVISSSNHDTVTILLTITIEKLAAIRYQHCRNQWLS